MVVAVTLVFLLALASVLMTVVVIDGFRLDGKYGLVFDARKRLGPLANVSMLSEAARKVYLRAVVNEGFNSIVWGYGFYRFQNYAFAKVGDSEAVDTFYRGQSEAQEYLDSKKESFSRVG